MVRSSFYSGLKFLFPLFSDVPLQINDLSLIYHLSSKVTDVGEVILTASYTLSYLSITFDVFIVGISRVQSARGTEPHIHGIWSTSFRLVGT